MESEREFFKEQGLEPPTPALALAPVVRATSVPPNLRPGLRIAKYELVRKIGSGAMGEVWAAKHVSLDEEVAIKIVMRDVTHEDGSTTESRFLLEAQVAAQLSRKTRHIVSVTDHGEDGPYAYLVMELLNGESLDARLARTGPMPLQKVIPIVHQVARALSVAHETGIVHRDLKPSNIFLTVDEDKRALVKILDFGIAKMRASMRRVPITTTASMTAAKHSTLRGFLLGTPAYMSPEQARGKQIDHRADVWALAVITFHLLTGQYPFDGETPEDLFARLCRVEPFPITTYRTDLPEAASDLFKRAFAERTGDRFQSAVALSLSLEHIELVQERRVDAVTAPAAISLPPPPPKRQTSRGDDHDADRADQQDRDRDQDHHDQDEPHLRRISAPPDASIIAAGVPRRRKLGALLVGGAAVVGIVLTTALVIAVYVERDPGTPRGLAAGATVVEVSRATTTHGMPGDMRGEAIPPPEPTDPTPKNAGDDLGTPAAGARQRPTMEIRPEDLPVVVSHSPSSKTTAGSAPPPPQPVMTGAAPPTAPTQPPPPPPQPPLDRSNVF